VVDKAYQGTSIGGAPGNQFTATSDDVVRDFAAAIDASPQPPERYELYFVFGNSTLTEASRKELPRIIEALGQRPAADMSITGHTDTAGDERRNERLGLERARQVADLLNAQRRIPADRISVESHGEKNPLIKTPDGVPEPRNRRVEVTVR
jgi:outer membrane protein OmpA-like peptidoglycan-associated protein